LLFLFILLSGCYVSAVTLEGTQDNVAEYFVEKDISRLKWEGALTGAIVVTIYGLSEYRLALENRDKQESEVTAVNTSSSWEMAHLHATKAANYNDKVKNCNQNASNATLLSASLFGLATWFWLNNPVESPVSSLRPWYDFQGKIGLAYSLEF